jgi:TetR/AcrR family transcriptional regulator, tetracycline repressor protein
VAILSSVESADGVSGEPPARRSAGRPAMAPERIVAAALALVDAEGADALSMRTLAQRLNSGTATLYRHFANRAELIAHVVDRVFAEASIDAAALVDHDWRKVCETMAHTMFAALGRHPHVARLLLEHTPMGPNAMAIREACLGMLLDQGFSPELAARCYATLSRYVLGFSIQLAGHPETHATQDAEGFHHVDPARFPATAAAADALPVPLEKEFAFGLELIINGLSHIRRPE